MRFFFTLKKKLKRNQNVNLKFQEQKGKKPFNFYLYNEIFTLYSGHKPDVQLSTLFLFSFFAYTRIQIVNANFKL